VKTQNPGFLGGRVKVDLFPKILEKHRIFAENQFRWLLRISRQLHQCQELQEVLFLFR